MIKTLQALFFLCVFPGFVLITSAQTADADHNVLRLGINTNNPSEAISRFQPMISWLAVQCGYERGEVVTAANISQMSRNLNTRRIDIYVDTPINTALINRATGATPLFAQKEQRRSSGYSFIFSRLGGMVMSTTDLPGKAMAFQDRQSASGFLVPAAHLASEGLSFFQAGTSGSGIIYTFSGSMENTVFQVLFNRVDAGAICGADFDMLPENIRSELQIVWRSRRLPGSVLSVSPELSEHIIEKIIAAVTNMAEHSEGRHLIETILSHDSFHIIEDNFEDALGYASELADILLEHELLSSP